MSKMTPEQEARYALGFHVARSGLSMAAQLEYERLLREGYGGPQQAEIPDAVFPALGVRVRGDSVESHVPGYRPRVLGLLAGAQAQLTDGHQA